MPRIPRRVSATQTYHVMIRGNEKKEIFREDEDRERFLEILAVKQKEYRFELYAFCLMKNHVHLLLNDSENQLAKLMKCINTSYAIYFNRKYGRIGHLFQDRFKSEEIDSTGYLLSAIRYIHNNPVKAGVADRMANYKWSSYNDYFIPEHEDKIVNVQFVLQMFSAKMKEAVRAFARFSRKPDDNDFIDINDSDIKPISTREEALKFFERLLAEKGISLDEIRGSSGKIKGTFKHEVVAKLKNNTNLTIREISDLVGISKSTVQMIN